MMTTLLRSGAGAILCWLVCTAWLLSPRPAGAIKGNRPVHAAAHPEVVLIAAKSAQKAETSLCTGVLIAPRAVLTAAHGVEGYDTWEVTAPHAKKSAATAGVKAVKVHPAHKPGVFPNDLAVVLLDTDLDIAGKYPTLHGGDLLPLNSELLVIGRVDRGVPSTTQLFQAGATLVAFPGDLNLYGGIPQVSEKGDSGGPVYLQGGTEVVALTGGQVGFSRGNVPTDAFIPISSGNREWIRQQVPRDNGDRKGPDAGQSPKKP